MELSGWQWAEAASLLLLVSSIAWADVRTMRIPDGLNLALGMFGLVHQAELGIGHLSSAVIASAVTALILYAIRDAHTRLSGRIGLGLGDVKFSAAAALWLQPIQIPIFFFIASMCGLVSSLLFIAGGTAGLRDKRIPFGPSLGVALVITWLASVASLFPLEYAP